jgi:hypothetical protein
MKPYVSHPVESGEVHLRLGKVTSRLASERTDTICKLSAKSLTASSFDMPELLRCTFEIHASQQCILFDCCVCASKERWWNRQAELLARPK